VPIDIARRVTPYLIREGSYDYPYLGIVSREDLTLAERQALDLPAGVLGAYVLSVTDGSPAARAGVRGGSQTTSIADLQAGGDLITAVDDQPIRTFNDLLNYLVTYKSPGEEVNLSVLRGDQRLTIQVELVARPQ
jgi:2-alkenal reductase